VRVGRLGKGSGRWSLSVSLSRQAGGAVLAEASKSFVLFLNVNDDCSQQFVFGTAIAGARVVRDWRFNRWFVVKFAWSGLDPWATGFARVRPIAKREVATNSLARWVQEMGDTRRHQKLAGDIDDEEKKERKEKTRRTGPAVK